MAVITSTSGVAPRVALVAQRGPLLDAEAVLLVDDHHAERAEADVALDEGVGADHDVDLARRAGPARIALRSVAVVRLVSSSTREGPLAEEGVVVADVMPSSMHPDADVVLLGEHLGGRHQRALVPALDGDEQRADGHDGLARADVALEQPVHRVGAGEVGGDLVDAPAAGRR